MEHTFNISGSLLHEIGLSIVNDEFPLSSPIPTEAELCKQYGVSRIIVREVVKMLSAKGMLLTKGMVTKYNLKGTWVRPRSDWNLLDANVLYWLSKAEFSESLLRELNEVRFTVEPFSAQLAAGRASQKSLIKIEKAAIGIETARDKYQNLLKAQTLFHCEILNASENRFYQQFRKLLEITMHYNHRYQESHQLKHTFSIDKYRKVLEYISKQDQHKARQATEQLLLDITKNKYRNCEGLNRLAESQR